MSAATVYERQFPQLQAHLREAITRYEAAEAELTATRAENERLRTGIRRLCDDAERNPAFYDRRHWPPYVYTRDLRALVGDETTPEEAS